jgi:hypothetical protein
MNTNLNPAFERLAGLSSRLGTGLNPAFERLASISMNTNLNPAFERLAAISMNSSLSPAFERLANLNSGFGMQLSPAFERLAGFNSSFGMKLNPAFERLSGVSPAFDMNLSPAFARLTATSEKMLDLSTRTDRLLAKSATFGRAGELGRLSTPPDLRALDGASRKNIALNFAIPMSMYKLSLNPEELRNANSQDIAQMVQEDIHLVNPEADVLKPTASYEVAPQNVPIHSVLAAEAR